MGTSRIYPANSGAIYHFCYVSIKFLFKNSSEAASGTLCRHVFDIWARDAKCCSVNGTSSPWQAPSSSYSNLLYESQCLEMSRITLTHHPIFCNASLFSLQFMGKGCAFLLFFPLHLAGLTTEWSELCLGLPGSALSCLTESCWQSRDAAPAWNSPASLCLHGRTALSISCLLLSLKDGTSSWGFVWGVEFLNIFSISWFCFLVGGSKFCMEGLS